MTGGADGEVDELPTAVEPGAVEPSDDAGTSAVYGLIEHCADGRAMIGRYTVLRKLGQGGMGVVFSAYDEQLDRRVAIKVLNSEGLSASTGRARIKREAQALARLSHPNVVHVYEVGEYAGQIYLAMEFVEGANMREWLHDGDRPWRDVLQRFLEAGEGLAAAHSAGLLHRDIKPDNLFLGEDGRVRVLDFGLARSGDDVDTNSGSVGASWDDEENRSGETTGDGDEHVGSSERGTLRSAASGSLKEALTEHGTLLGTPAYMSLEQLKCQHVDARSDQFSFCVSLYEGVFGVRPFRGRRLSELKRAILSQNFAEPRSRPQAPAWLRRVIRRGLAADPVDRWQDMDALLGALRSDPSRARRRIFGTLGVSLVAGSAGYGATFIGAERTENPCMGVGAALESVWNPERAQVIEGAILATDVAYASDTWDRLHTRLGTYADDWSAARVEVCEDAHATESENSQRDGELRLVCLRERRVAFTALLGVLERADAKSVRKALAASDHLPSLEQCSNLSRLRKWAVHPPPIERAEAVAGVREVLARVRALRDTGQYKKGLDTVNGQRETVQELDFRPLFAEVEYLRGRMMFETGAFAEARNALLDAWFAAQGSEHEIVSVTAANALAQLFVVRLHEPEQADLWVRNLDAIIERIGGDARSEIASVLIKAQIKVKAGEFGAARELVERAVDMAEARFGSEHRQTVQIRGRLGKLLSTQGEYRAAIEHLRAALAAGEQLLGASHPDINFHIRRLATTYTAIGELDEAKSLFERLLALEQTLGASGHDRIMWALLGLADVQYASRDYRGAERFAKRALESAERAFGPDHNLVGEVITTLGVSISAQGRTDEARPLLERALSILERALGPDHVNTADAVLALGDLEVTLGALNEAEPLYRRVLEIRERALGLAHPEVGEVLTAIAELELRSERFAEARAHGSRALTIRRATPNGDDSLATTQFALARAVWGDQSTAAGRERAVSLANEALGLYKGLGARFVEDADAVEAWLTTTARAP